MAAASEYDLTFLDRHPVGQGRLILNAPNGSRHVIQNLSLALIESQCSLLNFSFECATNRTPAADIDVPSIAAGISFVRFIYTKNYGWPSPENHVPLLLTAHVFALAHAVDYEELYNEAHATLRVKVNFAVAHASPPSDLCATIRFLWTQTWVFSTKELSSIKEDVLNYCVAAFEQHNLGSNPEFIKLSKELFNFHMDLSRTNFERDYEQVGILHLPGPNRSPPRPLQEDNYIACAFSSQSDEHSIDADDDIYSTDGTVSEEAEEDVSEDFSCANRTISEDEEDVGQDVSCANNVTSEDHEEGEGEDDEEGEREDDGEGDEDEGDEPLTFLLNLPLRPKPNSQEDTEFATAPTSPTSEGSFVVVGDSVQSTFDSESESESEWQVL